jgi:hypothetical protein
MIYLVEFLGFPRFGGLRLDDADFRCRPPRDRPHNLSILRPTKSRGISSIQSITVWMRNSSSVMALILAGGPEKERRENMHAVRAVGLANHS